MQIYQARLGLRLLHSPPDPGWIPNPYCCTHSLLNPALFAPSPPATFLAHHPLHHEHRGVLTEYHIALTPARELSHLILQQPSEARHVIFILQMKKNGAEITSPSLRGNKW